MMSQIHRTQSHRALRNRTQSNRALRNRTLRNRTLRNRALAAAFLAIASMMAGGCNSAEARFTKGRIENLCVQSVPVCGMLADCVLSTDQYIESLFPGGERVLVRSDTEETRLRVRFLLFDRVFPGSQISLRGHYTGCGDFDENKIEDTDLFDIAGGEGILELEVDVLGRGDHMLEVFSDMSTAYFMTVDTLK